MNILICKLSNAEYIKIINENNVDFSQLDYCCDEVIGFFVNQENQQICIGEKLAGNFFEKFINRIKSAIHNQLPLHESITQNLGFMWNEDCQNDTKSPSERSIEISNRYEIILNYNIWFTYISKNPMFSTWLYNDKNGNIIFEVTKDYPWSFFPDEPENHDFVTYEEFMKDYQSTIQRVIPREIAIEWLDQAMKAYRCLFDNEADFLSACKEFKL